MPENYKGLTVPLYTEAADGPKAFKDLVDSGPIPRFATAAERNTAIPAPVAGQLVYRSDLGSLEVFTGSSWQALAFDLGPAPSAVPTASVFFTARSGAPPSGFLLCNGGAYSRTAFAALFAAIGTTYGAGDGSTTFNVPDLRQRFVMGVANSGTGSVLGATGGQIDHVHSAGSYTTGSAGSHTHGTSGNTGNAAVGADLGGSTSGLISRSAMNGHIHHQSASTSSGGSHGHGSAGSHSHIASGEPTSIAGSHSHSSGGSHSHGLGSTGFGDGGEGAKQHTHAVSITASSAGAHSHSVSGTSGASNPPYITLHGIIKT